MWLNWHIYFFGTSLRAIFDIKVPKKTFHVFSNFERNDRNIFNCFHYETFRYIMYTMFLIDYSYHENFASSEKYILLKRFEIWSQYHWTVLHIQINQKPQLSYLLFQLFNKFMKRRNIFDLLNILTNVLNLLLPFILFRLHLHLIHKSNKMIFSNQLLFL